MNLRLLRAAIIGVVTTACGVNPPPIIVPTPPPPIVRTEFCLAPYVYDTQGRPLSEATVSVATGPTVLTNLDGYAYLYPIEVGERELLITKPGYLDQRLMVKIESLACDITVTLVAARPPPRTLPRIVTRGQFFALDNGQRFTAIGASDFNLLARFLRNEDIEPVLKQRADAGFNVLRVWTRYSGNETFEREIGRLLPSEQPDLYARLPAFMARLSAYGLYAELTAYTGGSRADHWERLGAAVQGITNVLGIELINEADSYSHDIRPQEFSRIPGILTSHGSNGAEREPIKPFWDYTDFHTNGAFEEQRKVGHNAWELWSGASFTNETSRYPDVGMWRGQTLARQQQLAYDSAAGAALLAAGSLLHSVNGKTSTLWGADALAVATAWAAGARSVDLACQDGPYQHPIEEEGPEDLRVYVRPVPGYNCIVRIKK